jgi:hypothetical protein
VAEIFSEEEDFFDIPTSEDIADFAELDGMKLDKMDQQVAAKAETTPTAPCPWVVLFYWTPSEDKRFQVVKARSQIVVPFIAVIRELTRARIFVKKRFETAS